MEDRPNNWGTTALTSVMTIALYLGDTVLYDHAVDILHGWLGDTTSYNSFVWDHELCWNEDEANPKGVNPLGAVVDGVDVDGVLPDDQRRGGTCPPDPVECENYVLSALAGPVVSCEIVRIQETADAWEWEDSAMKRAFLSVETDGCGWINSPAHNDRWQGWIVNWHYGSGTVATAVQTAVGKSYNFTDWIMPTCRWDFDGDGEVGVVDFLLILDEKYYTSNRWLDLLAAWGVCP